MIKLSVKNEVLKILENNRGNFVSGNHISSQLYVSRNAVWKAVNSLKNDGYDIKSVTNKGYKLSKKTDILSKESIEKYLKYPLNVTVFDNIDSTNKYLKKLASDGAGEGTVIVAKEQTDGRGRLGKSFYSPNETGVYFSILLRPMISAQESLRITIMTAVAVAETIKAYTDEVVQIKWVNDIYSNGKKLCGILTEGSVSLENGGLDYAVVGIGVNVLTPKNGFPDDIKNIATSVFSGNEPDDAKSLLIAQILNRFFDIYKSNYDYVSVYKSLSFLDGRPINIISSDSIIPATALYIDDNCHLVVKTEAGEVIALSSGDVSVRIK